MNPVAFLAELEAAGIHVAREGSNLKVQGKPRVRLAPYLERIREHKPTLLSELRLREAIVAAASVEPVRFDRDELDRLWLL